jgi:hypothetical protein
VDNGRIENTHLRPGSKEIPRRSQKSLFQRLEKIWDPETAL